METQQTQVQKKKMNGCLKAFLIGLGALMFFGLIGSIFDDDKDKAAKTENTKSADEIRVNKLQNIAYSELSLDDKTFLMDNFLEGKYSYKVPRFSLNEAINNGISMSMKNPETLEIKGFDGEYHKGYETHTIIDHSTIYNLDYEKGTFDVIREFTAEGGVVGVKLRKKAYIQVEFNGKKGIIKDLKFD